jgi:hypothetical protein
VVGAHTSGESCLFGQLNGDQQVSRIDLLVRSVNPDDGHESVLPEPEPDREGRQQVHHRDERVRSARHQQ